MKVFSKRQKHPLRWFENREGKEIIKNTNDLFNQPVKIASKQHAKALFLTQREKGYIYKDFNQ